MISKMFLKYFLLLLYLSYFTILLVSCGPLTSKHLKPKKVSHQVHQVLITGFYDWKNLGDPPEVRRCHDNPSCRILANEGVNPASYQGPLALELQAWIQSIPNVQIEFKILPVTWDSINQLNLNQYDQVIHLGLGVYDNFHQIFIEEGAYNLHKGKDATGNTREVIIESSQASILKAPLKVQRKIDHILKSELPSPFQLVKMKARADNSYLCNATHYNSLKHITPTSRLQEAYFIHIPHRQGNSDQALSEALAKMIKMLISDHLIK